jgi:hypothetical protein
MPVTRMRADSEVFAAQRLRAVLSPSGLDRGNASRHDTAVAVFRQAPSVDYAQFREDLDRVSSQDPTPHD